MTDTRERLRLAMNFIEEWANWWAYGLEKPDGAPLTKEDDDRAKHLGERARELVIENRQFLARPEAQRSNAPEHVCGLEGYNPLIDDPCPGCAANSTFSRREAQNIVNSADAQCFRWLLKHHSGSGKAMAGQGTRCWIGGVEFHGEDVTIAILEAIDREEASQLPQD